MEENIISDENKSPDISDMQSETSSPSETETTDVERSACQTESVREYPHYRKNGRNHSARAFGKSPASKSETAMCGEVEDLSSFKEKLSGSNVGGYGNSENSKRHKRDFRNERDESEGRENASKDADESGVDASPEASEDKEHSGPAFENGEFRPRAIEVPLSDKRPRNMRRNSSDDGVVSYTGIDTGFPSLSLFARIKAAISSIFGSKSKKGKGRKGKFRGDRKSFSNSNRHRHGGDKYPRKDSFKGDKSGGKRRYHDRRPNGGGKRSSGGDQK